MRRGVEKAIEIGRLIEDPNIPFVFGSHLMKGSRRAE